MELLFQNKYVKVLFSKEKSQIEHHWTSESYSMGEEQFKEEQLRYLDFAKKLKPEKGFVNSVDFLFTIAPHLQDWLNQELHPIYEQMKFKKAAFLVSKDFFTRFSIEQIFDDYQPFEVRYFDQEEEARKWLDD